MTKVVRNPGTGCSARLRFMPYLCIIRRARASPMPEPVCLVVKKGTNISRATSGGMGALLLLMRWALSYRMSMSLAPASQAVFARGDSTWSIMPRSALKRSCPLVWMCHATSG